MRTPIPRKRDANYTQGLNRCRKTTSDAFFHCLLVDEDKQAKGKDTIDWVEEDENVGELATYGGTRSGEKVMSDGAIKVNTSRTFDCPGTEKTLGLRIQASGFNDVESDS